ncbi:MAG: hypothetical protein DI626_10250, partial [Micavibrio aeruginosavorus]
EGDFKANYSSGGSVHEFKADQQAIDLAVDTAKALDIQIGGIDLLFREGGGYTICEANTFPGFKGLEKASGVNVPEKIFQSMERRLVEHRMSKTVEQGKHVAVVKTRQARDVVSDLFAKARKWMGGMKAAA